MSKLNTSQLNSTICQLSNIGLLDYLSDDSITDIFINRPYEIFIETLTSTKRLEDKRLSFENLYFTAKSLCILNNLEINNKTSPIYALVLPTMERCQIILPPACEPNTIVFAIRKPSKKRFSIDDWINSNRLHNYKFTGFNVDRIEMAKTKIALNYQYKLYDWEQNLLTAIENKDILNILKLIIEHELNFVTVGKTGSGKTSFCRSLSDLIDPNTRIITIEDTQEFDLPNQANHVHLLYNKDTITAQQLVYTCMRLKPDRIFLTEIRSSVAWDYLTALNTGHPGGFTSIHANDSLSVFNRIADLCKESETAKNLDYNFILNVVKSTIDIVFFFKKTNLVEIYYNPIIKRKSQNNEL